MRLTAVLTLLLIHSCICRRCVDDHEDCADWADDGECKNNPTFMMDECRKSCGACLSKSKKQQNPSPQQLQPETESAGAERTRSQKGPKRDASMQLGEALLSGGAFSLQQGKLIQETKAHESDHELLAAAKRCNRTNACIGFSIRVKSALENPKVTPFPTGEVRVYFASKSGLPKGVVAASINETRGWVSFIKESGGQCNEVTCEEASWLNQQVASFHLRSAELFSEEGAAGAQVSNPT